MNSCGIVVSQNKKIKDENMVVSEIKFDKEVNSKIRLAAYCRVSSDSTDQHNSFMAQIRYYTDYTKSHPEYELIDIYADEGITGTSMKQRSEFNRLIIDCQRKKIDCIITKSVSRFARNTNDLLVTIRMLKGLGVRVCFEEQGIDTDKINMEMFLTIPGLAAQQESQNISDNMRWSYKKRMESGEFIGCKSPYGFDMKDGKLIVNKVEAKVVKRIFGMFLSGMGKQAIANTLNAEKVPLSYNRKKWHMNTISYILTNEKYIGDALLQKKYTTDDFPHIKKLNKGEMPQYYVHNSNEAIINKEVFYAVQSLINSRKKKSLNSTKSIFMGMLKCGECKHSLRKMLINKKIYYGCSQKLSMKSNCSTSNITEDKIIETYCLVMDKLKDNKNLILDTLIKQLELLGSITNANIKSIREIDKRIADISAQNLVITKLHTKGILDYSEYQRQSLSMNSEMSELKSKRKILIEEDSVDDTISKLKYLDNLIKNYVPYSEFDEELFSETVEQIILYNDKLEFYFIGGLKIFENIT